MKNRKRHTLQSFIASKGRAMVTKCELQRAGFTWNVVKRALDSGILRQGVLGFWLAREADPGVLAVMKSLMQETRRGAV